jgi:hypothetical protein
LLVEVVAIRRQGIKGVDPSLTPKFASATC